MPGEMPRPKGFNFEAFDAQIKHVLDVTEVELSSMRQIAEAPIPGQDIDISVPERDRSPRPRSGVPTIAQQAAGVAIRSDLL